MFPAHSNGPCLQLTLVTTVVVVVVDVMVRSSSVVEVSVLSIDPTYDRDGLISGKPSVWTGEIEEMSWKLYTEVTMTCPEGLGTHKKLTDL